MALSSILLFNDERDRSQREYNINAESSNLSLIFGAKHQKMEVEKPPLQFLDLPLEIRLMVYEAYYRTWTLAIYYDKLANKFRVTGFPSTALSYVSRSINTESQPYLSRSFNGTLRLRDVRVHRRGRFGFQSSLEVVATMGIDKLLSQVHTITVEDGTTGMLGLLPWHKFPLLRIIELEESLRVSPLATGKLSRYWPFDSKMDKDGRCHICGIFGYDHWTTVPDGVKDGRIQIVSVKKGFATSGTCLKAAVVYKADGGEFMERIWEDDAGEWKWIVTAAGEV